MKSNSAPNLKTSDDLGISQIFREEFEQQREFDNVFDILEDKSSDDNNSVKLSVAQFRQYSLTSQIKKLKTK